MKSKSFSLLELVIVLAIITLVTVVAVNRFGKVDPNKMRLKLNNGLQDIFIKARMKAQLQNKEVVLTFSRMENTHVTALLSEAQAERFEEQGFESDSLTPGLQLWLGEAEQALPSFCRMEQEETVDFYFYPDGEASGQGLVLQAQGFQYIVNVDRLTSRLILHEK